MCYFFVQVWVLLRFFRPTTTTSKPPWLSMHLWVSKTHTNQCTHVQYTSVHTSMILCSMYHIPKPQFSGPLPAFQYYTEMLGMGLGMRLTHSCHLFSRLGIYMYIYLHVCMYVCEFSFCLGWPPPLPPNGWQLVLKTNHLYTEYFQWLISRLGIWNIHRKLNNNVPGWCITV